jgi:hypothetical protein
MKKERFKMKRIFSMVMVVFALTFGVAAVPEVMPQVSAEQQPYWNGDTNYPMLFSRNTSDGGIAWYLDKSSVVVERNVYEGSDIDRIWAENIIVVRANENIDHVYTIWYRDSYGTMYSHTDGNDWKEFDPWANFDYIVTITKGCRLGWAVAFGVPFT